MLFDRPELESGEELEQLSKILYQFSKVAREIKHLKYIANQSKNEQYL